MEAGPLSHYPDYRRQKAVKATITHFSRYALFGVERGLYNYQRMAGDSSGAIYAMSWNGKCVYYIVSGDAEPTVYADLTSVIGYGSSYGDLARNPDTGDLYIGNGSTVYRLTRTRC